MFVRVLIGDLRGISLRHIVELKPTSVVTVIMTASDIKAPPFKTTIISHSNTRPRTSRRCPRVGRGRWLPAELTESTAYNGPSRLTIEASTHRRGWHNWVKHIFRLWLIGDGGKPNRAAELPHDGLGCLNSHSSTRGNRCVEQCILMYREELLTN